MSFVVSTKRVNKNEVAILWTLLDTLLPKPCSLASLLCHSQKHSADLGNCTLVAMLCRCCLALWLWRWRAQGLLSVSGAVEPPWMKRLINWALSDRATIRIYAQTVSLLHSESNSLKRMMNFWRVASRIGACKRSVPKEPNKFAFSILWTLLDTLLPKPCSLASLLCHSQEFPHHTIRMWQGAPLLWSVRYFCSAAILVCRTLRGASHLSTTHLVSSVIAECNY